jgi:hypothetical protein
MKITLMKDKVDKMKITLMMLEKIIKMIKVGIKGRMGVEATKILILTLKKEKLI